MCKLASYRIVSNVYNWIEDFLSNGSQRVRVGKDWPTKADVLSGIPQGSVLRPILFTILYMTYRNVSKAVAKYLLMVPKHNRLQLC